MLAVISPAKTMDPSPAPPETPWSAPEFSHEAAELANLAAALSPEELARLMDLNPDLARLNWERFQTLATSPALETGKQAALLYRGDTYRGLDADSLTPEDWGFAQNHLAILSGLYGVLRPLDRIHPYRLEMGIRLSNPKGRDLYAFWGTLPSQSLRRRAAALESPTLINLASEEYAKVIVPKALDLPILTPVFKERRVGPGGERLQVIGLMAKRARGAMARFIIRQRLTAPEALRDFTDGGYAFRPELSSSEQWVFVR